MIGDGQNIKLIIHYDAVMVFAEGKQEPLIKSRLDLGVRVSSIPLVHVHRNRMQLLETGHRLE